MKRTICVTLVLAALLLPLPALGAEATIQSVEILGTPLNFSMYTLYDAAGNATNYVKLRDVAWAMQYTTRPFDVDYDGSTVVTTGVRYTTQGGEMAVLGPVASAQVYTAALTVDGVGVQKEAILVKAQGEKDGHFYYKLRDLGEAIGFTVGWDGDRGIYIETP